MQMKVWISARPTSASGGNAEENGVTSLHLGNIKVLVSAREGRLEFLLSLNLGLEASNSVDLALVERSCGKHQANDQRWLRRHPKLPDRNGIPAHNNEIPRMPSNGGQKEVNTAVNLLATSAARASRASAIEGPNFLMIPYVTAATEATTTVSLWKMITYR